MIHVNFGWLNDYSGSKFAPFTLADKVLLNTEHNTTESFYDYVKNQNTILTESIQKMSGEITGLQNKFIGLTEENVADGDRVVANQAKFLVTGANQYLKKGSLQVPVYFEGGIPQLCNTGTKVEESKITVSHANINGIITGYNGNKEVLSGEQTYQSYTNNGNYLAVNISGMADHAKTAEKANTADTAIYSSYSYDSTVARSLLYSIKFGAKPKGENYLIDLTNSDLQGEILTTTRQSDSVLYADGIQLKDIHSEELSGGGAHEGSKVVVDIPVLTVDTKGRITKLETHPYIPQLDIANIINTVTSGSSNITQFPLLTASGSTGAWGYYTPGASPKGVYIEYDASQEDEKGNTGCCILMGAAWNDYAEFRDQAETIEPGYCVASGDDGKVYKTTEKFQACDGIVSDTYGFSIGKTATYQTPLAVSGRVLAYCEGNREDYHSGDTVCASANGKVCKMTREEIKEYPDRIVGIVSEIPQYEKWNNKNINGRIWIKVK